MAERFINNIDVGYSRTEEEKNRLQMYKSVASLIELSPIYVYFSNFATVTNASDIPQVALFGTDFKIPILDWDKLSKTIPYEYVFEITMLDAQVDKFQKAISTTTIPVPTTPIYIKMDNISDNNSIYDFEVYPPVEKTFNRNYYLKSKSLPSVINVKMGHVFTQESNPDYGKFFDINSDVTSSSIAAPFKAFYNQSVYKVSFRLQIRQIHIF